MRLKIVGLASGGDRCEARETDQKSAPLISPNNTDALTRTQALPHAAPRRARVAGWLWHNGNSFALELKAPGGRLSEAQLDFLARFNDAGGHSACAEGLDRALADAKQIAASHGISLLHLAEAVIKIEAAS